MNNDVNPTLQAVLERFPKQREPLPPEFQAIYNSHYQSNREGDTAAAGMAQKLEQWMHHKVAADVQERRDPGATLEIGAGTLNHFPYEPNSTRYDIVEPFAELYATSSHRERVGRVFNSVFEVEERDAYDRIISIATFEHVLDLPQLIAQSALLLKRDGCMRVAIPAEGSLLWYLGWRLTTGIEFLIKYRLNYATLMRHEHINNYREVALLLGHFFDEVNSAQLGPVKSLSFYQFYECRGPRKELALDVLEP